MILSVSCKQAESSENTEEETVTETSTETPDYDAFNKKIEVIRAFYQAHSKEDIAALESMLSDTLQWSPPGLATNAMLGKADLVNQLKLYHEGYDNIRYEEGVVTADSVVGGFYSGSHYPKATAANQPDVIRVYGTWFAQDANTGKEFALKFFSLVSVNKDGKIINASDYFDTGVLINASQSE